MNATTLFTRLLLLLTCVWLLAAVATVAAQPPPIPTLIIRGSLTVLDGAGPTPRTITVTSSSGETASVAVVANGSDPVLYELTLYTTCSMLSFSVDSGQVVPPTNEASCQGGGALGHNLISESPTAVTLDYVDAFRQPDGSVTVLWETSAEINHAGYNVYRVIASAEMPRRINPQLIASRGVNGQGAAYQLADPQPPTGAVTYILEDVDLAGKRTQHAGVMVAASSPTSVQLGGGVVPQQTGGGWMLILAGLVLLLSLTHRVSASRIDRC